MRSSTIGRSLYPSVLSATVAAAVLLVSIPSYADMSAAPFDNLDKRAFALGEINGYLTMCGAASAMHHRDVITGEAKAAGASDKQVQSLVYAFDKGLSAGATAAPLQFKGCGGEFYAFLEKKNDALSALQKQSGTAPHK